MSFDIRIYSEQRKCEHPDVVAAYDLQCEIERLEKSLADYKEQYDDLMEKLVRDGIRGKYFNITELRPRREVNVEYVREHLPEAYDKCATISNSTIIEILETTTPGGKTGLIHTLKKLDPRKFNKNVKINVGDLEKFLGKKIVATLDGTAVKTVYHPGSKTKVLYIGDKIAVGAGDNEPQEALE